MKGLFVTATNTERGKTLVSAGILKFLHSNGYNCTPFKPVQTGAVNINGELQAPDLNYCLNAIESKIAKKEYNHLCPYIFEPACSPHLAAEMTDTEISFVKLHNSFEYLYKKYSFIVAEGAGGIMVPLNGKHTNLDLMNELSLPVILVSHTGLGTINDTLLSIASLKNNNIDIAGIIYNNITPEKSEDEFIRNDNPKTIEKLCGINNLGNIPYLKNGDINDKTNWRLFLKNTLALQEYLKKTI